MKTERSPEDLLTVLLAIERSFGRVRKEKWEARILDLDILFYGSAVMNDPQLIIPHPFLHERKFVLIPLAEIAPELIHPIFKKTVEELLKECADEGRVTLLSADH